MRFDQFQWVVKPKLLGKPRLPPGMDDIARLQDRLRLAPRMHDAAKASVLARKHFGHEFALAEMPRPQHDGIVDPFHQASPRE